MIGLAIMLAATVPGMGFKTGDELLEMCRVNRSQCIDFVAGASDAIGGLQAIGATPVLVCTKPGVTVVQLTDVAVQWLEAHPQARKDGAGGLIWAALVETFPCPKN
jgi:Rap1a immunity proteins